MKIHIDKIRQIPEHIHIEFMEVIINAIKHLEEKENIINRTDFKLFEDIIQNYRDGNILV